MATMRLMFLFVAAVSVTAPVTPSKQSSRDLLLDPDHQEWQQAAPAVATIVFETSKGRIVFEMRREWAPHGADRFYNLVRNGFHDKEFVPFARVIEGLEVADALHAGYGEGPGGIRAGRQNPVFQGGNAYLLKTYPRLDYIVRAVIRR
jgi:hypothetical protein